MKEQPTGILRKSEARMAAVKALYAFELSKNPDEQPNPGLLTLDILSSYDVIIEDDPTQIRPDEKFLSKLISKTLENVAEIDIIIQRNLNENWTKERMNHVMIALLRAAVFELSATQKLPVKVIINEYLNIAHAFFTEKDTSFINGILDKIAREVRF